MSIDYGLLIRALEKHVRISQNATTFFREHRKGKAFTESMVVLQEALAALEHVRRMQALERDLLRLQKILDDQPVPQDGRMSWPHSFTDECTEEKTENSHPQNLKTKINGNGENS